MMIYVGLTGRQCWRGARPVVLAWNILHRMKVDSAERILCPLPRALFAAWSLTSFAPGVLLSFTSRCT